MWIVDSLDILRKPSENLENRNDYVLFKELVLEVWLQVDLIVWSKGNQRIIQTKMEVGIRFWAPNLGVSPKYD